MSSILLCFPGGRHKALTLSYDDGNVADRRLIDIMNRYGVRGTFHLNSALLDTGERISAQEVRSLYEGHEVSAHTLTHPTIARCPREQIVHEIMEDRKRLEHLAGYTVRGMSYPNGSYDGRIKRMLPELGIEYSRIVGNSEQFDMPLDWLEWKATCHHNTRLLHHAEDFINLHKTQYLYLMYVWGHSYEFDRDGNWELIEEFCRLAGGREDIWYATNIEIVDYMKAFECLKFSADFSFVYNPTAYSIWLRVDGRHVEVKSGEQVRLSNT
ncbi:polysaccharide deacetylase family protein [Paenibacillus hexagrammi]|uniref:Polysaccharide deacetylase family protein n=1 Tax=Paenibacillus hexagrammi TaxID=2908839 RepID=A0ABY3SNW6_9BACL|nr:polysaccharide deacetylase family protein [Paenibacillus sp. YPD9-1]UJF34825.1 polysaccharide deacetylase family protein [Paenibacillus sp. YPD9-1]